MNNIHLIRINSDIGALADEILGHIPLIDGQTYCDPAMGGGQLIARVEARLRAAGKSDAYIRTHVFGYEASLFDVMYAKARWKLVGTYEVKSLEELEKLAKKFDVILINPPYQDGSKGDAVRKNKGKLWPKFFELTRQLVKPDGYVGFISPTSWMSPSKESFVKVKMLTTLTTTLDLQVAMFGLTPKYFPSVGVDIGAIVYQNRPYQGKTVIGKETFDLTGMMFIPVSREAIDIRIIKKIASKKGPRFNFGKWGTGNIYVPWEELSKTQDKKHKYPYLDPRLSQSIMYAPEQYKESLVGVPKIHMTMVNGLQLPKFVVDEDGKYGVMCQAAVHLLKDGENKQVLESILNSKLTRFIMRNFWHTMGEPKIANLIPNITGDLYDYFDLTQEERNYINDQVK